MAPEEVLPLGSRQAQPTIATIINLDTFLLKDYVVRGGDPALLPLSPPAPQFSPSSSELSLKRSLLAQLEEVAYKTPDPLHQQT